MFFFFSLLLLLLLRVSEIVQCNLSLRVIIVTAPQMDYLIYIPQLHHIQIGTPPGQSPHDLWPRGGRHGDAAEVGAGPRRYQAPASGTCKQTGINHVFVIELLSERSQHEVKLHDAVVIINPFDDMEKDEEEEAKKKQEVESGVSAQLLCIHLEKAKISLHDNFFFAEVERAVVLEPVWAHCEACRADSDWKVFEVTAVFSTTSATCSLSLSPFFSRSAYVIAVPCSTNAGTEAATGGPWTRRAGERTHRERRVEGTENERNATRLCTLLRHGCTEESIKGKQTRRWHAQDGGFVPFQVHFLR
jgi:hypothetical protein